MAEGLERLEARMGEVEGALARVEARLLVLENAAAVSAAAPTASAPTLPAVTPWRADLGGMLGLAGRTLVILAGAYLLRALTESGTLDNRTGVILGVAYALAWTIVAWIVPTERSASATFYGGSTVMIAFPLLWEATTRFALWGPAMASLALAGTTAVVLVTAWRRNLYALAWIATTGAIGLALPLLVMTGGTVPVTCVLVALGIATLWLGYGRDWGELPWLAAAFADLAVLGLAGRALTAPPRDEPAVVMAVQLTLLVGYLGSIAIRTLVRGRNVVPFEVVQTPAMLVAGLAGALLVAHQTGTGDVALGLALLGLALASYAVAFAFVDRQQGRGTNFYFYASLALVFALAGSELVLRGPAVGVLWASFATLVGWTGRRLGRGALIAQSVVYVVAAAFASGLWSAVSAGLFASAAGRWAPVGAAAWAVLVAIGLCRFLSASAPPGRAMDLARGVLSVAALVGVAGAGLVVAFMSLPAAMDAPLLAGAVATLRTAAVAVAALVVAWLGRRPATREFRPLLYVVLGWGAVKLLAEDFRTSPPSLLFVALALYGGALVLGPRIASMRSGADAQKTPTVAV